MRRMGGRAERWLKHAAVLSQRGSPNIKLMLILELSQLAVQREGYIGIADCGGSSNKLDQLVTPPAKLELLLQPQDRNLLRGPLRATKRQRGTCCDSY